MRKRSENRIPARLAQKFKVLVAEARTILIAGTGDPDADSIGAQLALYEFLTSGLRSKKRRRIDLIAEKPCPVAYRFLRHSERFVLAEKTSPRPYDLGIVCDGGLDRAGAVEPFFKLATSVVRVDHHKLGDQTLNTLELNIPESSSTCEVLFDLITHPVFKGKITPSIAEALYLGIAFDTGLFKHSLATPKTYRVGAELIATGIDFSKVVRIGLLERSPAGVRLLGAVLSALTFVSEDRVAIGEVSRSTMQSSGAASEDREGIIDVMVNIRGVDVAVLLTETDQADVRISMRCHGRVNVAELCRTLTPSGGGHARAAGCRLPGTLADVRARVVDIVARALNGGGNARRIANG